MHEKIALAAAGILLAAISIQKGAQISHAYCHGGSAEARSTYCETVYSSEPGYRALQ